MKAQLTLADVVIEELLPEVVAVGEAPPGTAVAPVAVGETVGALLTLIMSHKRESSSTCMINPSGFLITKLPRYVPAVLGATRSTEISAVSPGFVTGRGTEAGALIAFSE